MARLILALKGGKIMKLRKINDEIKPLSIIRDRGGYLYLLVSPSKDIFRLLNIESGSLYAEIEKDKFIKDVEDKTYEVLGMATEILYT